MLVTNYSLEYMLLRPIERSILWETRRWLESDSRNQLLLILDEAHMYRGVAGAEVGLLIRRLQSRLGIVGASLGLSIDPGELSSGFRLVPASEFGVGARWGKEPGIASLEEQRKTLAPLARFLELEGWSLKDNKVPLLAIPKDGGAGVAIGTYPALP